jgi:hypothetical protein
MPRISNAQKVLRHWLADATDPAEVLSLAQELNRLIAQEERKTARARRARAKRQAEAASATRQQVGRPLTEAELALPFEPW